MLRRRVPARNDLRATGTRWSAHEHHSRERGCMQWRSVIVNA